MEQEKKYFLAEDSRLDSDSAAFAVSPNAWVNAENVRTKSTDKGVTGTVESVGGTLLISSPQPSITFLTIGQAEEQARARFCYFKKCTTGPWDKIVCFDKTLNQEFDVMLSSQVTGGFNFDKNSLIDSKIVNGLLYWTDDLNDQRKINIDAGIKLNNASYSTTVEAYTTPIAPEVITVLRPPPAYPLSLSKFTQVTPVLVNNFIEDFAGQFSYRYYYRDGETSKPSVYSLLAPYNIKADTFNRIDLVVPFGEYIEQDVSRVDILVKYGNENTFYSIKSWDKTITSEAQEIANHNAGISPLTYQFYNDTIGEAQSEAYSLTPFDSVPVLSKAMEVFDNRLGFGNNLEGYDTPKTTSLGAEIIDQTDGGTITGQYMDFYLSPSATPQYYLYVVSTDQYFSGPFYYPPPLPTLIDYGTMTLRGTGLVEFTQWLNDSFGAFYSLSLNGQYTTVENTPSPLSLVGQLVFKSGAVYKLSTVFYDYGDRKCGITGSVYISGVPFGQVAYQIPDRDYNTISYVTGLRWSLSNADAVSEIPLWATHFSVCITRCLLTRYFLQARSRNALHSMTYVNRDTANAYTFTTSAYDVNLTGVGVDITNLQNFGMGYVYSANDIVNIYIDGDATVYRLKIIGQEGRWIICELQDLGTLDGTTEALFQIYTPYIQSINEPYHEVAQTFAINNAGTISRQYSVLAGTIRGDVTILERGLTPDNYLTENMSPNDKYYLNWYTDRGRPNFVDRIGQQRGLTNISYSNVLIPGTRTNGLSSFDALDERNLPQECGGIQKLVVTSKVQDELGIVMLAICVNETASIYVGEVQLYGSNAPSTLAQAPGVIGTINVLKGSRGTTHPESVTEYRGNVFWWDDINGKYVQYGANGLFDISNYKMTRFWKLFSDLFNSMSVAEIEALGSRPYVFSTVDPHHNELLISIPKLSNNPPKGYLPDYITGSILTYNFTSIGSGYTGNTGGIVSTSISNGGVGLTDGVYTNVDVPGSPSSAKATVTVSGGVVTSFVITNMGYNYSVSSKSSFNYSQMGGTGSGVVINILSVQAPYTAALTGGTGSGATAYISVGNGIVFAASFIANGDGYTINDVLSVAAASVGGTGSGFSLTVTSIAPTAGTIYPFDIYDCQGKTMVYKLDTGEGKPFWMGAYKFNPEFFATLQNKLYSFKYGHLYLHNQTTNYNEFYGVQYSSKIMVVANQLPNKPKEYNNVASESNLVPSFVYMYCNYPIQQSSDLVDLDFDNIEGGFFCRIRRNKLVPTANGYTTDGLLTGEKMRNATMFMMFEWRVTNVPLELKFINIGYNVSRGYNI